MDKTAQNYCTSLITNKKHVVKRQICQSRVLSWKLRVPQQAQTMKHFINSRDVLLLLTLSYAITAEDESAALNGLTRDTGFLVDMVSENKICPFCTRSSHS